MKRLLVCAVCIAFLLSMAALAFAADAPKDPKDGEKKDATVKVIETPKKEEPKKDEPKKGTQTGADEPKNKAEDKKDEAAKDEPKKAAAPAASPAEAKDQMRKVQIGIRKLSDKLVESMKYLPEGKYGVLAVLNFQETGKLAKEKELGALVAMELATYLHKDHRIEMVEREKIDKVMGEIALGQSGVIDESTAAKVGKMVQAQALVVGSVAEAGADFLVNARMVSVENGMVLVSDNTKIPVAGMVALSSDSVVLRSKSDAVYRSFIPGWGQIYNKQLVKGVVYSSVFTVLVGTGVYFGVSGGLKEQDYKDLAKKFETDPTYQSMSSQTRTNLVEHTKQNAQDRYLWADIAFGVAGAFWAWNLLDAYLWGYDAKSETAATNILKAPSLAVTPDGALVQYGFGF